MTGSDFLTYVKRVFKRTDKDTEIYEAMADTVADIRLQLKTEDYKEEAYIAGISTLGEYRIALPSDFKHLIGNVTLVDNSGVSTKTLNKISKQTYDEKYGDRLYTTTSNQLDGEPVDFCIYAEQIYIGPVPDSISYRYYINYTTEDYAAIVAGTTLVPFTDRYRSTVRSGVLAEVYAGLEALEESNYWRALYVDGLVKIKSNDDDNIADNESIVYHGI
jgi:hypothetical protein